MAGANGRGPADDNWEPIMAKTVALMRRVAAMPSTLPMNVKVGIFSESSAFLTMFKKLSELVWMSPRRCLSNAPRSQVLSPFQEASMNEQCIVVDESDNMLGAASKLDCHRIQSDGSLILHRAFSLFIFNSNGDMLVQQRSPNKVTFPDYVANACCSHPLYEIEEERNEKDAIGVKLAAQRRMNIELGVPKEQTTLNDFHYITRIIYRFDDNVEWGEHELDYILFLRKDVDIVPNPEEVSNVKFISQDNFKDYLENLKYPLTPWFSLFASKFLPQWWCNLDDLQKIKQHSTIHKLT